MITPITSRENRLVKEYVRLSESRGFRYETKRFVIEGARLLQDALLSGVKTENVFFETSALHKYEELCAAAGRSGAALFEVSRQVAEKMSDTKNPQGVFCTAFMLDKEILLDRINIYSVMAAFENIQDPGNLGTMLRTAEAFGVGGVILSPGCADIYSPKAVRAGMGAVFRLPFAVAEDFCSVVRDLGRKGMRTFAAVPDRDAEDMLAQDFSGGGLAVVGNEGSGLTQECVDACGKRITIRMRGRAESLNAAAAASVLMWEMTKRGSDEKPAAGPR